MRLDRQESANRGAYDSPCGRLWRQWPPQSHMLLGTRVVRCAPDHSGKCGTLKMRNRSGTWDGNYRQRDVTHLRQQRGPKKLPDVGQGRISGLPWSDCGSRSGTLRKRPRGLFRGETDCERRQSLHRPVDASVGLLEVRHPPHHTDPLECGGIGDFDGRGY